MRVKLEEVCKRIYAGGDVPIDRYSEEKTEEYNIPIYANAEKDNGLYGYTDEARETELSITVAARGTIGFTAIRREPFLPVVRLITVVPDLSKVSERYLFYALKNCKPQSSGTSIPQLTVPDIKKNSINLLDISEQESIADRLDKLNGIIKLRTEEIAKLDELIKARFVELFGDPRSNPNGLSIKTLDQLGVWNSGGTPSRNNPDYFTGNINWYSAGELNSLYLDGSIEKITEEAIKESAAKMFKSGSMLVGMYDTAAFKMGILKEDSASNQACACIEPNESVDIVWLYYALTLMKDHYLSQRRGVRQKNLNLGMIRGFELPVAPKTEQKEFVEFVRQADKSKVVIQKSLNETQRLFDSLMQEYFG